MAEVKPKCRLYLQLPAPLTARLEARLTQVLAHTDPACVLVSPGPEPAGEVEIGRLIDLVHAAGTALLIENDAALARRLGADGVHLSAGAAAYAGARDLLGQEASIGAWCGESRHEAMGLAEKGADYLAFGPSAASLDIDAIDQQAELIAWWAEIFVVPCVAWNVDDPREAERMAVLGADFVAPSTQVWDSDGAPDLLADIERAISQVRRAA